MSVKAGIFDAVEQFLRIPRLDESELIRNADHVLTGPRGRKIYFLKDGFTGDRANASGFTSANTGNVFISGDIRGDVEELHETVQHEIFHSVLVPRSRLLNDAHIMALNKSPLYLYVQEASAQAYASRSLWKGMRFPIRYGYVRPSWLVTELAVLGVAGYGAVTVATDSF
jgi:hypothetical protein